MTTAHARRRLRRALALFLVLLVAMVAAGNTPAAFPTFVATLAAVPHLTRAAFALADAEAR